MIHSVHTQLSIPIPNYTFLNRVFEPLDDVFSNHTSFLSKEHQIIS